jgi:hypothetical protein
MEPDDRIVAGTALARDETAEVAGERRINR